MDSKILCVLLTCSINAMSTVNDEFNRNTFDDEMEYSQVMDPNFSQEIGEAKNHFFRQIRSFEEDYKNVEMIDTMEEFDVPNNGYFRNYYEMNRGIPRNRRSIENEAKPLEIRILDLENGTEATSQFKEDNDVKSNANHDVLKINDFIRFKRDLLVKENDTDLDDDKSRTKREKDEVQGAKETKSKEQWVKQPYPVRSGFDSYDNTVSSDSSRAPRVNFVTQRRSESAPPPVYRNYDERGREMDREIFRDEYPRDERKYYSRVPRYYKTYSQPFYPQNYYQDDYRRDRPFYEPDYKYRQPERPIYNKQKRIIYYATLPEVVRTPPNVDLRDMYTYRGPYDIYTGPRDGSVGDPYMHRKPPKSRYDENLHGKTPYPLKVSTDLNVREIKKNPERRIYTESDRRYAYREPPYQPGGRHF